jgi:hypothetical protein
MDVTTVVDRYIAAWNAGDRAERQALLGATFTEDADYLDPLMSGSGLEGIDAMIGAAREQFPGHRFALAAAPDAHHDRVRFTWHLVAGDGSRVATGIDFATVANDGRLRSVTGFLEPSA